jgi:hypothetical protein
MIVYTNFFVPDRFAAITIWPFVFIKPQYKDDIGLRKHEEVHLRQFLSTYGLFWAFYLLSKKYRLNAEVEAYKEQLRWYDDDRTVMFAVYISTKYKLNISVEAATALLKSS